MDEGRNDTIMVDVKPYGESGHWLVEFSAPVSVPQGAYSGLSSGRRWVACSDHDPFEFLSTDALGAYTWGIKLIKWNKEQTNA